ncbi:uncharacterized protein V1516DRAFT_668490 [Lipomyces oligophaga]|uniref:uncharacterized protein n=1 Tax=Lipomyces oligophaga TaxID=45792 RepID=UPI0034CF2959
MSTSPGSAALSASVPAVISDHELGTLDSLPSFSLAPEFTGITASNLHDSAMDIDGIRPNHTNDGSHEDAIVETSLSSQEVTHDPDVVMTDFSFDLHGQSSAEQAIPALAVASTSSHSTPLTTTALPETPARHIIADDHPDITVYAPPSSAGGASVVDGIDDTIILDAIKFNASSDMNSHDDTHDIFNPRRRTSLPKPTSRPMSPFAHADLSRSVSLHDPLKQNHSHDNSPHLSNDFLQRDPLQPNQIQNAESRISAYARLDFASFTFYVQTLQVVMGRGVESSPGSAFSSTTANKHMKTPSRKPSDPSISDLADRSRSLTPSRAQQAVTTSEATASVPVSTGGSGSIDVHLGTAKAISRRHAKIFYNFASQQFEFSVLGRNGAFVDDVFVEKGATVSLNHGSRVQIGQVGFTFLLPSTANDDTDGISSPRTMRPADAISMRDTKGLPEALKTSFEVDSAAKVDQGIVKTELDPVRGAPSLDLPGSENHGYAFEPLFGSSATAAASTAGIQDSIISQSESQNQVISTHVDAAGQPLPDSDVRMIEALTGIGGDSNLGGLAQLMSSGLPDVPTDPALLAASAGALDGTSTVSKSGIKTPGSNAKPSTKRQERRHPTPPSPSSIPPEYREKPANSYSSLIEVSLRAFATERGMSLAEIYGAIQELFPYYRYAPYGWQNSVRHNLSLNKVFVKIAKEGKGWLWGLDEELVREREAKKNRPLARERREQERKERKEREKKEKEEKEKRIREEKERLDKERKEREKRERERKDKEMAEKANKALTALAQAAAAKNVAAAVAGGSQAKGTAAAVLGSMNPGLTSTLRAGLAKTVTGAVGARTPLKAGTGRTTASIQKPGSATRPAINKDTLKALQLLQRTITAQLENGKSGMPKPNSESTIASTSIIAPEPVAVNTPVSAVAIKSEVASPVTPSTPVPASRSNSAVTNTLRPPNNGAAADLLSALARANSNGSGQSLIKGQQPVTSVRPVSDTSSKSTGSTGLASGKRAVTLNNAATNAKAAAIAKALVMKLAQSMAKPGVNTSSPGQSHAQVQAMNPTKTSGSTVMPVVQGSTQLAGATSAGVTNTNVKPAVNDGTGGP